MKSPSSRFRYITRKRRWTQLWIIYGLHQDPLRVTINVTCCSRLQMVFGHYLVLKSYPTRYIASHLYISQFTLFFFHLQTSSLTVFNYRLSLEKKSPRDTGIFCPFWILFFLPRLRTKRPSNIDFRLCLRFKKKQHCCQQPIL